VVIHNDPARSTHEVSLLLHVTPSFLRMCHLFLSDAAASLLSPFHVRSRAQTHKHTRVHAGNVCGVHGEDHDGEFPSVPTLPVAYLGYTWKPMK
jgi:hypothetical protein